MPLLVISIWVHLHVLTQSPGLRRIRLCSMNIVLKKKLTDFCVVRRQTWCGANFSSSQEMMKLSKRVRGRGRGSLWVWASSTHYLKNTTSVRKSLMGPPNT